MSRVRTGRSAGVTAAALVALGTMSSVASASARATPGTVTFAIDTVAGRQPISPLIYGINLDDAVDPADYAAVIAEARPALVRLGGNRWTAYNWEDNFSNAGSDYLYENDQYLSTSTSPGAAILSTVKSDAAGGITTLVTIPIAGLVAGDDDGPVPLDNPPDLARFKMDEPTDPDPLSTTPDTKDDFVYQNQFVYWLTKAAPGAPLMFSLDNEPDLWSSTHQEIHPDPTTYTELLAKDVAYAAAVHKVDPAAPITGPVSYGWEGYLTLQNAPDSAEHGNFLEWWMRQIKKADTTADTRLVTDLDLHWYPEATGGGTRITGTETTPAVVAAREQAPRSLWDKSYVEDSWITQDTLDNKGIDLIPRLDGEIAADNPGMKLDFSEWNYGAGQSISGAIATDDVLGVFGRYGVHASALWPLNADEAYNYAALAMYRNYDGKGSSFGDTEVKATTSDDVSTSVYASIDKADPSHVVIMAINKGLSPTKATIDLSGADADDAAVYTLTSAAPKPRAAAGLTATGHDVFTYDMPAQSVSVIVPAPVPAAPGVCLEPVF